MDRTLIATHEEILPWEWQQEERPPRNPINPIDEDLHFDEPVVFGPDGSGEAADRARQPYGGAD
jgi:hypothetical protein